MVPFSGSIYIETVHTTSTSQTGAQVKVLQMEKISNDFKTKSSNLKYNSIGNSGTFSLFKVTYSDLKWHITMLKKVQCSNGKIYSIGDSISWGFNAINTYIFIKI